MEHTILGIILLICVVLLVTGLRMLVIVTHEVGETIALSKATLDARLPAASASTAPPTSPGTALDELLECIPTSGPSPEELAYLDQVTKELGEESEQRRKK